QSEQVVPSAPSPALSSSSSSSPPPPPKISNDLKRSNSRRKLLLALNALVASVTRESAPTTNQHNNNINVVDTHLIGPNNCSLIEHPSSYKQSNSESINANVAQLSAIDSLSETRETRDIHQAPATIVTTTVTSAVNPPQQQQQQVASSSYRNAFITYINQFALLIHDAMSANNVWTWQLSRRCHQDVVYLTENALANVTWALKMFDSMGKPSSGLMEASLSFLGHYSECVQLESPKFNGQYCLVNVQLSQSALSTFGTLAGLPPNLLRDTQPKIGICAPSTCKNHEVSLIANKVVSRFVLDSDVTVSTCYKQTVEKVELHFGAKICLAVFGLVITLVILATLMDLNNNSQPQQKAAAGDKLIYHSHNDFSTNNNHNHNHNRCSFSSTTRETILRCDTGINYVNNDVHCSIDHQHQCDNTFASTDSELNQHSAPNQQIRLANCQQQIDQTNDQSTTSSPQLPVPTETPRTTENVVNNNKCCDAENRAPASSAATSASNQSAVATSGPHKRPLVRIQSTGSFTNPHIKIPFPLLHTYFDDGFHILKPHTQQPYVNNNNNNVCLSGHVSSANLSDNQQYTVSNNHEHYSGISTTDVAAAISNNRHTPDCTTNQTHQVQKCQLAEHCSNNHNSNNYSSLIARTIAGHRSPSLSSASSIMSNNSKLSASQPIHPQSTCSSSSTSGWGRWSLAHQLLMSFSLRHNTDTIFDTTTGAANVSSATTREPLSAVHEHAHVKSGPPCIAALHGLKFISMIWIIINHSYSFALQWMFFANPQPVQDVYKTAASQLVANGTFAVDSFFFVSGFLVCLLSLDSSTVQRQQQQQRQQTESGKPTPDKAGNVNYTLNDDNNNTNGKLHHATTKSKEYKQTYQQQKVPLFPEGQQITLEVLKQGAWDGAQRLFHRYIRMMPLMMAIIGFGATLLRYMGDGPAWIDSTVMFDMWCRKNWYINMIFMHNFINRENMCLSHSWYTAVDMQLFIMAQVIMFLLNKKPKLGFIVICVCLAVTQLTTAVLTILHHLPAVPYFESVSEQTMDLYYGEIYIKPYCRAGPYLIGMILAYLLRNNVRIQLTRARTLFAWTATMFAFVAILMAMQPAMNGKIPSDYQAALYSSLSRPLWAICMSWVIYACMHGHGGFVDAILSAKIWIPFSRLTYPAFLIHPIVMALFYGSRHTTFDFSHYFMVYLILGNIAITSSNNNCSLQLLADACGADVGSAASQAACCCCLMVNATFGALLPSSSSQSLPTSSSLSLSSPTAISTTATATTTITSPQQATIQQQAKQQLIPQQQASASAAVAAVSNSNNNFIIYDPVNLPDSATLVSTIGTAPAATGPANDIIKFKISEGLPNGTYVGTLATGGNGQNDGQYLVTDLSRHGTLLQDFNINQATGEIRTATVLDRERINHYSFSAIADRKGNEVEYAIIVTDVNDNRPQFYPNRISISIPEYTPNQASNINRFIRTLPLALDADSAPFGVQDYRIIAGNHHDIFKLSKRYEPASLAAATSSSAHQQQLQMHVASFKNGQQELPSLQQLNNNEAMNKDNQQLYVDFEIANGHLLDRENQSLYQLTIEAIDGGQPPLSGQLMVDIQIHDLNDNKPIFTRDEYEAEVKENAPLGTIILRVQAHDADTDQNGQITYHILKGIGQTASHAPVTTTTASNQKSNELHLLHQQNNVSPTATTTGSSSVDAPCFSINSNTGEIYLARELDYETEPAHLIFVEARDGGTPAFKSYSLVNVKVL
ncbi:Protein dachsous, partial [Fragariocoptes setiger]